jgi:hypothetical protein
MSVDEVARLAHRVTRAGVDVSGLQANDQRPATPGGQAALEV